MTAAQPQPPTETLWRLWLRFLRFGALAWGGPVAQIGALHHELVVRERWVDEARFRKVLAVYQVLPGPEATELCIWFGTVARGRIGGLLAGLGFLLPGLSLMLLACWLLLGRAHWPEAMLSAFVGMQAAVVALVVRAAFRLWRAGVHSDATLLWIALAAIVGQFANVPFAASLLTGGVFAMVSNRRATALVVASAWLVLLVWSAVQTPPELLVTASAAPGNITPPPWELAQTGLRAGLLTFGGAYTAIPFLQDDAVGAHGWMTLRSFQDGLAIGGVLPSPLIVFGTWVGFAGGGFVGAAIVTAAIFLPAFLFPLMLHDRLERIVAEPRWQRFLDGVTAAVVGLIATVALQWTAQLDSPLRATIAGSALLVLCLSHHRLVALAVMAGAALTGLLLA